MVPLRLLNKAVFLIGLLFSSAVMAAALPMPTLELRMEAQEAFLAKRDDEAKAKLAKAAEIARHHASPYVQSNELRYIAAMAAQHDAFSLGRQYFAEAMAVANTIPLWNHRLYASIGVLELQSAMGDKAGAKENGLKAIEAGLLETVAATGEAAETGRFFTALDGVLTGAEREQIARRIRAIEGEVFRKKSMHALFSIKTSSGDRGRKCRESVELSRLPLPFCP